MGLDAPLRRTRRWLTVGGLVVAAAWLPAAAEAKPKPPPKPPSFTVTMTFLQARDWAYDWSATGESCYSTVQGNGSDSAKLTAKATFLLGKRRGGFAGIAAGGTHSRTGTMTSVSGAPNYQGADCGGPPQTREDPTTGCGVKPAFLSYAALNFVGETMTLRWDASSSSAPDFSDCPYLAGALLPGDGYQDVNASGLTRQDLLGASKKHPAYATGHSETSLVETCGTGDEGCAEGVAFSGSATVKTDVVFEFVPIKRKAH
jgi:hypothetical protein